MCFRGGRPRPHRPCLLPAHETRCLVSRLIASPQASINTYTPPGRPQTRSLLPVLRAWRSLLLTGTCQRQMPVSPRDAARPRLPKLACTRALDSLRWDAAVGHLHCSGVSGAQTIVASHRTCDIICLNNFSPPRCVIAPRGYIKSAGDFKICSYVAPGTGAPVFFEVSDTVHPY